MAKYKITLETAVDNRMTAVEIAILSSLKSFSIERPKSLGPKSIIYTSEIYGDLSKLAVISRQSFWQTMRSLAKCGVLLILKKEGKSKKRIVIMTAKGHELFSKSN